MWPSLSQSNSSIVFSRNCVFLSFYGCYKMLLWNSLCKLYLDHGFCSLLLSLSLYCRPWEEQTTHKNDGFAHDLERQYPKNDGFTHDLERQYPQQQCFNKRFQLHHKSYFGHSNTDFSPIQNMAGSSLALRIKGAQLTRFWMPGWFLLGLWVWLKTGEWIEWTDQHCHLGRLRDRDVSKTFKN